MKNLKEIIGSKMKNSISSKIGLTVVATLIFMLSIMLFILLANEENSKMENTYKSVKETNDLLVASIVYSMGEGATDLSPFIKSVSKSESLVELKITPTKIIDEDAEQYLDDVEKKSLKTLKANYFQEEFNDIPVFRSIEIIRADNTCIDCHDASLGDALVVISSRYSMVDTYNSISSQRWWAAGMAVLAVAGMFIIIMYFVKKNIVIPIQKLNKGAEEVTAGKLDVFIQNDSEDEIGSLAHSFNEMVEKIAAQIGYLNNLPSPVLIVDNEFNIEYMNKAGLSFINKNSENVIGKKCYEQFKTEHCNTEKCAVKRAMELNEVITEETIANSNGKEYSIMYTGSPVVNREGKIVGALEFVADISAIKEIQNYLARSTKSILNEMNRFAEGDLTVSVTPENEGDDIEKLFVGFNETVLKINDTILAVIDAVEATASASTQISSSTEEMAAGAQEQSKQSAEVSNSVEEMTRTILDTSQNVSLAAEKAKQAEEFASEGGKIVQNTIEGMNKISEVVAESAETVRELGANSEKIGSIVEVINDIADQTNLLALNAAIEAARAGEYGRGFAVVADEVRKLAERTTSATKEINEMIKDIQEKTQSAVSSIMVGTAEVEKGKEQTLKAGDSIKKIIESSRELDGLINQIAAASEEQSSAAQLIQNNISGINTVTMESASGIEQVAKASEDLNQLTERLSNLVNKFKVVAAEEHVYEEV